MSPDPSQITRSHVAIVDCLGRRCGISISNLMSRIVHVGMSLVVELCMSCIISSIQFLIHIEVGIPNSANLSLEVCCLTAR